MEEQKQEENTLSDQNRNSIQIPTSTSNPIIQTSIQPNSTTQIVSDT